MRFFTDQFFSETQKSSFLENAHLIEHPSVRLADQGIQPLRQESMFYMEWQQDHVGQTEVSVAEGKNEEAPVMDMSAVVVMVLVGIFGGLFVFDVLLG